MQGYVLTGLLSFEGLAERTRNGEQPGESERSLRSRKLLDSCTDLPSKNS